MSADNKPTSRVLVVLPESGPTKDLVAFLDREGFEVMWAREGQTGYEIIDTEAPDALIADLRDSRIDGLRLLQVSRQRNPEICAILVGGPAEIELGVEAMRMGAYDFQVQPLNLAKVRAVLDRGVSHQRLVGEVTSLQRRLEERFRLGGIERRSSRWQRIYSQIEQVAKSKASVLITGETGTGKGEVAKAIHQQSRRRENAFVEINCGALPEGIVESELFGHEKGAFTGAATARKGRFEMADQGTLFLDEVGDLPLATQVKLLRAIQNGEFERVGGTQTRKVDVRIIAATNRNLEEMVERGTYRADLFYRLQVVAIEVPPLRECRDDIPVLVDMFIHQFARENAVQLTGLAPEALDVLMAYEWPGNVRELKNCIEGMVVMGPRQGLLKVGDIPRHIRKKAPEMSGLLFRPGMSLDELERAAIEETLKAVNHDRRQAARLLGIGLSTLYRKEKQYGMRTGDGGPPR
ncbi:MAG: sigma-54-dependent Fis family transcriptional regulator [Candidatus Latescibacteria bacterium]|nr:sigma-54-dependent Fis family transcriptional regulator [Candidatus Latescibacterota bacterium]